MPGKALHDYPRHRSGNTRWRTTPPLPLTWATAASTTSWDDASLAAIDEAYAHNRQALDTLKSTVDRAALTPADQLNYDLYARNLQTDLDGQRFHFYLCPLNQRGGVQNADEILEDLRVSTPQDYKDWLGPPGEAAHADPAEHRPDEGRHQGAHPVTQGCHEPRVPAQIAKQVVDKPEDSPFFKPFKQIPDSFTPEQKADLLKQADAVIADKVIPAYRDFQKFFETDYLPACYDGVGVWQMPNGKEAYAYFARQETTTDLTPEQIHQIGLDEVARIHGEMEKVMAQVGFKGTMPEFFHYLRTDPKFFYQTPGGTLQRVQNPGQDDRPAAAQALQDAAAS